MQQTDMVAENATMSNRSEIALNRFNRLGTAAAHKALTRGNDLARRSIVMKFFESLTTAVLAVAVQALAVGVVVAL